MLVESASCSRIATVQLAERFQSSRSDIEEGTDGPKGNNIDVTREKAPM